LWISTKKGLSRFDPANKAFKNFGVADGLQGNEFREAYCKTRNGMMYFGGINGFNEFYPDSIRERTFTPPLLITNFEIFNKKAAISDGDDDKFTINEHISEIEALELSHESSVISFEFATLNYTVPE